jgi:hypothetical protein
LEPQQLDVLLELFELFEAFEFDIMSSPFCSPFVFLIQKTKSFDNYDNSVSQTPKKYSKKILKNRERNKKFVLHFMKPLGIIKMC